MRPRWDRQESTAAPGEAYACGGFRESSITTHTADRIVIDVVPGPRPGAAMVGGRRRLWMGQWGRRWRGDHPCVCEHAGYLVDLHRRPLGWCRGPMGLRGNRLIVCARHHRHRQRGTHHQHYQGASHGGSPPSVLVSPTQRCRCPGSAIPARHRVGAVWPFRETPRLSLSSPCRIRFQGAYARVMPPRRLGPNPRPMAREGRGIGERRVEGVHRCGQD
jgi:hypothetical protein